MVKIILPIIAVLVLCGAVGAGYYVSVTAKDNVNFSSYDSAIDYTETHQYRVDETTDTSDSEWITSAEYKSIDGNIGFLILGMRGEKYIFDEVPLEIWQGFKTAEDKGKYYHKYIRKKYNMNLNDYQ